MSAALKRAWASPFVAGAAVVVAILLGAWLWAPKAAS